jgi:Domain of unknown function (DUF4913)
MSTSDDWDSAVTAAEQDKTPPEPLYPGVEEWVTKHLLPTYLRQSGPRTWCPQWWQHPEAVERLEALWRAWETLRLDATTGMSVWWRDHADHHLPILLSADGPFARCGGRSHQELPDPLPTEAAPPDWWVQRPDTHPEPSEPTDR